MAEQTVQAAGGLLWRAVDGGVEVALVHRPRYDDWSLPKGKLEPGEHLLAAGLREVREETGSVVRVGRRLGRTRYRVAGVPKRVTYWSMQHVSGRFRPSDEVDALDWVPAEEALARVHPDRDGRVLRRLLRDPRPTRAAVVVRHASAGHRADWAGPDGTRPLDDRGRAQAAGLVPLLAGYGATLAVSADVTRCRQTLAPWAEQAGVDVAVEPLLSERGYAASPQAADRWLTALVRDPVPGVFCTQGGALPDLVEHTCRALGLRVRLQPMRKGALVVLHLRDGADAAPELVAVEQLPAP